RNRRKRVYGSEVLLMENPRRKRRRSRRNPVSVMNPLAVQNLKDFYQGVSPMNAVAAVAGLAGATMLPGLVVRNTATSTGKALKIVVALGTAGVMGLAARALTNDKGNAQAAVLGGMAGALTQVIATYTGISIGNRRMIGASRRVGNARVVSPGMRRESETVSLITP
ncbi:MAG: hypothetical protein WC295_14840, partial [Methanoregula sp.]